MKRPHLRRAEVVAAVLALMVAACAREASADPASWLPRQFTTGSLTWATHDAATWETRPVCSCDTAIKEAGGSLDASTITQGGLGGGLFVTVVRSPGVSPERLLEAMVEHGQLEQISRSETQVAAKTVTELTLPAWAGAPAYLVVSRDALVLINDAPEATAFEFIRALP